MLSDLQLDRAAFRAWLISEDSINGTDLKKMKGCLPIVLNEYLTPKQRNYILLYFADQKSMEEIGEVYGVDKSTVSRVIGRGLNKAYGYLRFVSPLFMEPIGKRKYLTNGRSRKKKREADHV